MIQDLLDLYLKFPQLHCINIERKVLQGTMLIEGSPCTIEITLPNFPKIKNFKCILKNNLHIANISNKTNIDPNWNIEEFLSNLPKIWKEENPNLNFKKEISYGEGVLNILNQILACKNELNDIKMHVDNDLSSVKFDNFVVYPEHYLELKIEDFVVEVNDHSLPNFSDDWKVDMIEDDLCTKNLFSSPSTIVGYLKQFLKLLENFELFYKYINALDDLCWIVEPTVITTKINWRMFKLADNVYIKVTLNPLCPNSISVNFYGPTLEVEKYRDIYQKNVPNWDCELDVYSNLLKIFDLMLFPCKDATINSENDDFNCKICLCYLDDDSHVPICSCDNIKCNLIYHVSCLRRWFSNSTEGRTFLSVAIGVCPFCKEKLSASFRTLLDI
ncbi:E3 ubiquitin-protein ligase FANCL [Condylostylus longicornis]|uniref:E3 ubiquitin-protein ligase FANCL n=1 Tax=Condylostylus longicornis TaxID=2530218 RepID=UPI00244E2A9B|nr:E3 ubiquitin-protein ligase FANCL [Condylostylus longicornis]